MMFSLINLVITAALFMFLMFLLFPVEKFLSRIFKLKVSKSFIFLILLLMILLIVFKTATLGALVSFLVITFSVFVFLFGMLSNRKYIYTLALVSLAVTPIMLILKMETVAEFFAELFYFLLVLGVLKDIFYEKLFK